MNLEYLFKFISGNHIFQSVLFMLIMNMIFRISLFVVFVKVYKVPFEKAVDSSIRMTTFFKGK